MRRFAIYLPRNIREKFRIIAVGIVDKSEMIWYNVYSTTLIAEIVEKSANCERNDF